MMISKIKTFLVFLLVGLSLCWSGLSHAQLLTGFDKVPPPVQAYSAPPPVQAPTQLIEPPQALVSKVSTPSVPISGGLLTGFDDPVVSTSGPETLLAKPQLESDASVEIAPWVTGGAVAEVPQPVSPAPKDEAPVNLQADQLDHNEETQIITASGNVVLEQSGRVLIADQVSYNLNADQVTASGNVRLKDANGDVHETAQLTLKDEMKNGFVTGLKSFLVDGSRFTATEGERKNGVETTMVSATYTPCEPCEEDPEAAPVWQIKAAEVTHDSENKRISYKHARFEFLGVPLAYMPYFSHPDGSIKRKSGFLSPAFGYKSELGAFATNSYYWDIAPDFDATFGLMVMTDENPLGLAEIRKRWDNASLELSGGITYSGREDSVAGVTVTQDEEIRGHILGEGLWNINDKWRSGLNIEWATDDQYMRQYDFENDDILENELYAERFSGRNYAVGRLLTFQDIRVREDREDQPEVLPEIITSFLGEPGAVPFIKGRWSLDASFLGLRRSGDDPDMNRMSVDAGWQRRLVSDFGLLTDVEAHLRGDFYSARDRAIATAGSGISQNVTEFRSFPQLHIQSSYPVAKAYDNMQVRIEPMAALTLAPNINTADDDIPNEDSQDVQIDASNLFEPDRFPGLDRIEDQSRVTYGLRTGVYGHDGSSGSIFLGQSYRLDEDDNPFPEGSGLNKQESDVVGQISGSYKDKYNLDYRFQLASSNLASQRHEVDLAADFERWSFSSQYLFAKALEGTDIDESREQIEAAVGYYIDEDWRVRVGGRQDFGENPGLRRAYAGVDYFGQCLSWSLTGQRNLTDDASGDSDIEILFRIGLKNLGEFQTSGLRASTSGE